MVLRPTRKDSDTANNRAKIAATKTATTAILWIPHAYNNRAKVAATKTATTAILWILHGSTPTYEILPEPPAVQ